jgi:ssDNA-binding Zn-finger/Zn-ribbon topoisomerase 1
MSAPQNNELFNKILDNLVALDPVEWAQKHLMLDGKPFSLGAGYKPFADIYRYVGVVALNKNSKPIIMVKGRQIGASTLCCVIELYFMTCGLFGTAGRPPIRVMHCFPQLELAYAFSKTKLSAMISSSVDAADNQEKKKSAIKQSFIESKIDASSPSNDSLQFKQFVNGNHLFIESTGLTADRLRSRTVDVMFIDEAQDTRPAAMSNGTKILSKAQYGIIGSGVQLYFGTPKQRGTEYWKIWNKSSQQYFHLGCESCGKHFPFYTPEPGFWEKVWIEDDLSPLIMNKFGQQKHGFIVKCTECGFEQDKREAAERGKWIAYNKNENCEFVGYHINMLYMPEFSRKTIMNQKPENSAINTERAWQNEVLGEFFSGDASPITPDEIDQKCADRERIMSSSISIADNKRVYLGCDWGQKADIDTSIGESTKAKQGQSYSCVVVLVTDGPHILSIEYAFKLKRNDIEYKKAIIEQMFRQYSVNLACGDIGYAGDLTEILQREYGERFLGSMATSRVNGHVKYKNDFFPSTIIFEKNYYMAELYGLMKQGKIRFPYGDFEKIGWLVEHCCSMEIKQTMDRSGETGIMYVKGTTPNDGFCALLNAFLAHKYDITNGFTISNPNDMTKDPSKKQLIPALSAYIPGFCATKR